MNATETKAIVTSVQPTPSHRTDKFERTTETLTPTQAVCRELQGAYSYYNRLLFGGELPECMLTLHERRSHSLGYYRPNGFESADGLVVDQISINPAVMLDAESAHVLSILVHEMCHLWVNNFCLDKSGNRKRITGYHCKKWVGAMEQLGLIPSDTGAPGGKQTGYRVSHYIVDAGPFDLATKALIAHGFAITWGLAEAELNNSGGDESGGGNNESGEGDKRRKTDSSKGKVRFECPSCKKLCWAAPTRKLICGDDHTVLVPDH